MGHLAMGASRQKQDRLQCMPGTAWRGAAQGGCFPAAGGWVHKWLTSGLQASGVSATECRD